MVLTFEFIWLRYNDIENGDFLRSLKCFSDKRISTCTIFMYAVYFDEYVLLLLCYSDIADGWRVPLL